MSPRCTTAPGSTVKVRVQSTRPRYVIFSVSEPDDTATIRNVPSRSVDDSSGPSLTSTRAPTSGSPVAMSSARPSTNTLGDNWVWATPSDAVTNTLRTQTTTAKRDWLIRHVIATRRNHSVSDFQLHYSHM